ncbi:MAG: dihydrofolate reductase family protein [Gemmatimonadota bacterium]|jgi:dihydrofolate reductase
MTTRLRRVIYSVAATLDGYIADPAGGVDWIPEEPTLDWAGFLDRFDTALMGRRTYEAAVRLSGDPGGATPGGLPTIVFSRTLGPQDHPGITVTADDPATVVARLREAPGKDLWLMGGGALFRSFLEAKLVDGVEVAVVPVVLGAGVPLLPDGAPTAHLALARQQTYPSGIVLLMYEIL